MLKTQSLSPAALRIIRDKSTEYPFSGEYNNKEEPGTYLCRQCGLALFRSQTKFHSGCGWPSFDEEIADTVKRTLDADGHRIEITCRRCDAHLGHAFEGEGFTEKNLRHCVNSVSLEFVPNSSVIDTEEAIFAAGCFWGVEALFKKLTGVLKTEVGYTGGKNPYPTYEQICNGSTGHFEAIRIIYDPTQITFCDVVKYFFEIHDPTQSNGQGPDLGQQYLSVIFYYDQAQKKVAEIVKSQLEKMGLSIATQILPVTTFWPAEEYHQNYYEKTGKQPYCHHYVKRF